MELVSPTPSQELNIMISDKRLEQLKKEIQVWDGKNFIAITEDFFKDSSNFPSGWCTVNFYNEINLDMGWVNQNGEYLTGETKFNWCSDFKNGLAWVRVGSKYTFIEPDGTDFYTGKLPTEDTCKFNWCFDFSNGLAEVLIGSNKYHINILGLMFNTSNRITAEKKNKEFLKILNKYFYENSLKRYIFEEIV